MPMNKLDPQCRRLCQAINHLPGLRTYSSCCGHSRTPFVVFCKFDPNVSHDGLVILTRAMDRRYWRYGHKWSLELYINDVFDPVRGPIDAISFEVTSQDLGRPAYAQANDLANNILVHLEHTAFLHAFNLTPPAPLVFDPLWAPTPMRKTSHEAAPLD